MKNGLSLDLSKVQPYASLAELDKMEGMVNFAHNTVHEGTGAGSDFLGWLDLPVNYDKEEFARIKVAANKIKENSDVLIVIGIGGSYLGARAAIEGLTNNFYNMLPNNARKTPKVFFVGNNISSTYISDLFEAIEGLDVSVNVISKSGTTLEPAITFRTLKVLLEENGKHKDWACTEEMMSLTKDGKALYLHCLPADITGVSCEEGEVDATVFDRYRVPLYKEASYKPYVIAAMIFLSKFKNPVETLKELERKGTDRVQP